MHFGTKLAQERWEGDKGWNDSWKWNFYDTSALVELFVLSEHAASEVFTIMLTLRHWMQISYPSEYQCA
jgi:hypothetical protein